MGFYGRDGGFWISVRENGVFTDEIVDFRFLSLKLGNLRTGFFVSLWSVRWLSWWTTGLVVSVYEIIQ